MGGSSRSGSGWISWLVILSLVGAGGWYYRKNAMEATAQATSGKGGGKGRGGDSRAVPVVVVTASTGDMPVYLRGLGTVTALSTVTVKSRVDGQINSVNFKEGQFVKEGDLLVQIDPRPFQVQLAQAEGQLAKDEAALKDAKANYDRYVALFKEQVIAQQQMDTQLSQVGVFQGSIQVDKAIMENAKLQLVYCKITSPVSGRVGLRLVDPGNIVHASDSGGMITITEMQPISVVFNLPQESLPMVYKKLRNGEQLNVEAFDSANVNKIASGKLLTIDSQIDPSTGTYKLKAQFDNQNQALFPNQFVNVRMLVETKHGLTLTPAAAVQRGPSGSYVYLVEDKKAKVRAVTVAITEGESVGLSDGLEAGAVVVVDGMDKLQDNSPVETGSGRNASTPGAGGAGSNSGGAGDKGPSGKPRGGKGKGTRAE